MAEMSRVRIFVDFWNFQLQWNRCHTALGSGLIQIPWKEIPAILTAEISKGQPARFAGIHVYASIAPDNPKDRNLSKWLHHTLASYPGYSVEVKERKSRAHSVRCQDEGCQEVITSCPKCDKELRITVEKGIDAAIITDLISMAFDGNYDMAILVSGDADYAPAVQYIQKKTDRQIVQAFFKQHGDQLRTACWDHIFFEDMFQKFDLSAVDKPLSK